MLSQSIRSKLNLEVDLKDVKKKLERIGKKLEEKFRKEETSFSFSLKLFPNCVIGKGSPYSFHFPDFRVRVSDEKTGFSVYDPVVKKWIVFRKREKTKEKPFFPLVLETSKLLEKEKGSPTFHLLLVSSCGAKRAIVMPKMDKINEKFRAEDAKNEKDVERLKSQEVISFINALSSKPYVLLTNDEKLKERIEKQILSTPKPQTVKEEMTKKLKEYLVVSEDPVKWCWSVVSGSEELFYPKEFQVPKEVLLLGVLLATLGVLVFHFFPKKEEKVKKQEVWTPSPSFKLKHAYYKFFEGNKKDLEKFFLSLFTTPEGFRVSEANIDGQKISITFESPNAVIPSEKRKFFRTTVEVPRSSPPSWESLRNKPPVELEKFKEVYFKDSFFTKLVRESTLRITPENFEGVKLVCAEFEFAKPFTSSELKKLWKSIPKQIILKGLTLSLSNFEWNLQMRGKVCGR
jgi:hypothetical protein